MAFKKSKFYSMGDTIFYVLEKLCRTPNNEAHTSKSLIEELVSSKIDSPYYGFGWEEILILEKQGYISYQTLHGEENLPDFKKCIVATPKAFELVEARKSRINANVNARIASSLGLLALFISIVTLFKEELLLEILLSALITARVALFFKW